MYHKSYYICPLSTSVLLSPKPVTITFVSFALYGHTLVRQLPVPLQPLSFTPNLITVILSTINSLILNYPVSSRSRTLLLILSLKLQSPAISLPSYALSTGSESMNTSNTSSSLLPTKFSQLANLHNLISVQCSCSVRSSSVVTLARPPSSSSLKITHRHFRYASPCLWNQLPFISLSTSFWYQFLHFLLTYSFSHHFFLFCFTTPLIHNSFSLSLPA